MEKLHEPSDPREQILHKLNSYSKFFFSPLLPNQSSSSDLNSKEILMQALKRQNHKGQKLIKLTKNFYSKCEDLHQELIKMESSSSSQLSKIRQLESQIAIVDLKYRETSKKLAENEESFQEYRGMFDSISEERENLSSERDLFKVEAKSIEEKYLSQIKEIQDKNLREKEEFAKKIKMLEKSLTQIEESSEEPDEVIQQLDQKLAKEKMINERYRVDISLLKSNIIELEKKLEEARIKKSRYKEKIFFATKANLKNNSTQTSQLHEESFSQIDSEESCNHSEILSNENDLKALEEEQSLAQSEVLYSLGAHENSLSNYLLPETKSENLIVVFPKKNEEKYKIVPVSSFSLTPKSKSQKFSISRTQNYFVKPFKKLPDCDPGAIVYAFPAASLKRNSRGEVLLPKFITSNSSRVISSLQSSPKSLINSPKAFKVFGQLKTESMGHISVSANKSENTFVLHSFESSGSAGHPAAPSPLASPNPESSVPDDPIKDYFIKLCQVIKSKSDYNPKISQIPTNSLFQNLKKNKVPLYRWPDAIQLYLSKRSR